MTVGLFLIYTGFWGFYAACNVPIIDVQSGDGVFLSATNIYLQPTTLSAITVNFLMSLSGGMMTGYWMSKGNGFWTYSGGLAGITAASAGNDLYHPIQAMIISGLGVIFMYKVHCCVERRFKIDDAVGAVTVHGYAGWFGVVVAGFVLWGYPSSPNSEYAAITPWGQFIGAMIMFWGLGFIPAYILGTICKNAGILRVPQEIELAGLDVGEMQSHYGLGDEVKGGRGRNRPFPSVLTPLKGEHDNVYKPNRKLDGLDAGYRPALSLRRQRDAPLDRRHGPLDRPAFLAGESRKPGVRRAEAEIHAR